MTREEALKELWGEAETGTLGYAILNGNPQWLNWLVTERMARRAAEAELDEAKARMARCIAGHNKEWTEAGERYRADLKMRDKLKADLADARREVERLKEMNIRAAIAVGEAKQAAAQAREKAIDEVWDMFLTYVQGEDETAEGIRGALAKAIRALQHPQSEQKEKT